MVIGARRALPVVAGPDRPRPRLSRPDESMPSVSGFAASESEPTVSPSATDQPADPGPTGGRPVRPSASGRGRRPISPTIRATTRNCSPTATPATSLTRTAKLAPRGVVADIDERRHPFHVAIENFAHDANIGTVVRTANAFAAAAIAYRRAPSLEPSGRDGHRPTSIYSTTTPSRT